MFPPQVAEVPMIFVIADVTTVGDAAGQSSQVGTPLQNFNVSWSSGAESIG